MPQPYCLDGIRRPFALTRDACAVTNAASVGRCCAGQETRTLRTGARRSRPHLQADLLSRRHVQIAQGFGAQHPRRSAALSTVRFSPFARGDLVHADTFTAVDVQVKQSGRSGHHEMGIALADHCRAAQILGGVLGMGARAGAAGERQDRQRGGRASGEEEDWRAWLKSSNVTRLLEVSCLRLLLRLPKRQRQPPGQVRAGHRIPRLLDNPRERSASPSADLPPLTASGRPRPPG